MGLKRTDEFRQDAVRMALTSGLTRKQVAGDLGLENGYRVPGTTEWLHPSHGPWVAILFT